MEEAMHNALTLKGIVKKYRGFTLGPLDLTLEPGRVLAYIGPNGAGKTTTMHCISGLVKPDAGTVTLYGAGATPFSGDWKQNMGYVGDTQAFLEDWTAEQNLAAVKQFYASWSDTRASELCSMLDLPLHKKVTHMSAGSRVKLSLVRTLAFEPRLLMLDEPFAGLDPVARADMIDCMFSFIEDRQRSILFSTHTISDIERLADEIVFLDNGTIVQRSLKEDLAENFRRFSFFLKSSLSELPGCVSLKQKGDRYEAVSSDCTKTARELQKAGAANVAQSRMNLEEIAVTVIKMHKRRDMRDNHGTAYV